MEKAHPRCLRPGRPISVSAVPFGPGIDIWRSSRVIAAMMRSLCLLPGGLGRFLPCSIGANHCRLRHIGWERCGHGLTSRHGECAAEGFLDQLLLLFQYPPKSSRALLDGTLPLRYCSTRFASRVPTWSLPMPGHVAALVHAGVGSAADGEAPMGDEGVHWVGSSGPGRKRIRLNRKNPAHLVGHKMQSRPRVWKRLHYLGNPDVSGVDCKRRHCNQYVDGISPVHPRTGVG